MTTYVALLRAVNVGGTGKLPMSDLKAMCLEAGFTRVETYIASGNVVFESKAAPSKVRAELESRLHAHAGKPVGVILQSASELLAVHKASPFSPAPEGGEQGKIWATQRGTGKVVPQEQPRVAKIIPAMRLGR